MPVPRPPRIFAAIARAGGFELGERQRGFDLGADARAFEADHEPAAATRDALDRAEQLVDELALAEPGLHRGAAQAFAFREPDELLDEARLGRRRCGPRG